jgi:phage terminase large subunit-like protein
MISASDIGKAAKSLLKLTVADLKKAAPQLKRFESFCTKLTTEDGGPFVLEWWQKLVLLAYFAGVTEIVIVVPKGNGKTGLLAALAVFHLLTTEYPEAYIGASSKKQANVMYEEVRRMSQLHAAWRKRLIPRPSTKFIYVGRGAEGGFLQVLASDRLTGGNAGSDEGQGTLEGIKPTLGLVDELHAHVNDAIYAAIQGALHKRAGQMLTISTAGTNDESLLKTILDNALKMRGLVKKGKLTVARGKDFLLLNWALTEKDDREDMGVVKQANPSSFVTVDNLASLRESPSMKPSRWAIRHCNIWGLPEGGWLEGHLWDGCERPKIVLPSDEPIVIGFDYARSYDHAVLVALRPLDRSGRFLPIEDYDPEQHEGGRGEIKVLRHFKPEDEDGNVPFWKVKQAIREECAERPVAAVGFDKLGGFAHSAEDLVDEGIPMVEVSMKGNVWGPLTAELYSAVKGKRLHHDGDIDLRKHVLAGETKDSEWGERLHGRTKSRRKVDALMATGMAWYTAFFTDALDTTSEEPLIAYGS